MSQITHSDDDYLSCNQYEGHEADASGFSTFVESDQYYFALTDANGKVILRSEGYSSEAGRDNGINSVKKNMNDESKYVTKQLADGQWALSLKAGNHQEIALSCPVDSEAAAKAYLPSERAKAAALAALAAATSASGSSSDKVQDDYLICREYEERINEVSSKYPGFITFQHENGKHYFAWVNDGQIVMRGEGYPTTAARDNGIESVIKNREIAERFKTEESHGAYFRILKAGNHQEIARSCPKDSEAALMGLFALAPLAALAAPTASADADTSAALPLAGAAAALAAGALSTDAGATIEAAADTDTSTSAALPLAGAAGAAAAALAATSLTADTTPLAGSTAASSNDDGYGAAAAGGGGFKWWWLLLPLLLLALLWYLFKGCSKDGDTAAVATPAVVIDTTAVLDTINAGDAAPVAAAATPDAATTAVNCDLQWILFDFDRYEIRSDARTELDEMAGILKTNADYTAVLSAHTDAKGSDDYNQKLSQNRANAAKDVLVGLGIDANRIQTVASSKANPIASNTADDSGRKFNRRVELFVKDKAGKDVCTSNPPAIPDNLKK
jgi:outer membrane protein OmpA-like peptidoglycan-associated protein/uncharacterized protein YegP (UPF0339 family)